MENGMPSTPETVLHYFIKRFIFSGIMFDSIDDIIIRRQINSTCVLRSSGSIRILVINTT